MGRKLLKTVQTITTFRNSLADPVGTRRGSPLVRGPQFENRCARQDKTAVVTVDRRIRWHYTTTILRLVHDSRGIEIVNFRISLALSAGTLMASAGSPYRLVPAHFYPCKTVLSV